MSKGDVINFMQTYQRITQHMFKNMPKYASIVLNLNHNHQIKNALYKKTLYYRVLPTGETDYGIPPTFKVKLPYYNGELGDIKVLNEKNESIPYDLENFINRIA